MTSFTTMIWSVQHIQPIPVQLDFTSSEQGRRDVTAIDADGVRLINALELVDFEDDATQVHVCEECGFTRCAPGGWISFRRIAYQDAVVGIPAWSLMEEGDESVVEYRPPSLLETRGLPVLAEREWEQIRRFGGTLPPICTLRPLNSHEAARSIQRSAPCDVLGKFPSRPRLNRRVLDAVVDGDLKAEADVVDAYLHELFAARDPMTRVSGDCKVIPVEFITSVPEVPLWSAMARMDGEFCVLLDGLVLKRGSDSG